MYLKMLIDKCCDGKAEFWLQSSVSHDASEIILKGLWIIIVAQ